MLEKRSLSLLGLVLGLLMVIPPRPLLAVETTASPSEPRGAAELRHLIDQTESALAGAPSEAAGLNARIMSLADALESSDTDSVDRRLALGAARDAVEALMHRGLDLEAMLAAGEREAAARLYREQYLPICFDLTISLIAAESARAASPSSTSRREYEDSLCR